MSSGYAFEGLPLTPAVFAAAAVQVAPEGAPISRTDLIDLVVDLHETGGGLPPRSAVSLVAKKGLAEMQAAGLAELAGVRGYWRIRSARASAAEEAVIEFGEGREAVYVYFFPAYRDQAAYLGREAWPIKVGMSTGDVALRTRDQCGTAMPEPPIVGLIYRTHDARSMERMVHSTLKARGKHLADAPGAEWFCSSVAEVQSIIEFSRLAVV